MTTEVAEAHELALQAQALERENITEKVLSDLEQRYTGLTIAGPDDKTGLQRIHDARMQCRSLRVLAAKICKAGREEAVAEQRRWLQAEKLVTARIEAVEKPLQSEEERITAEIARIRKEKAEAQARMIAERTAAANAIGWQITFEECKGMKDQDFSNELHRRRQEYDLAQEKARIEADRLAAQQAERDHLAAEEAARIEAQQAELLRKEEELAAREREIREREEAARRETERIEQDKRHAAELEEARKQAAEKAEADARLNAEQAERAKKEAAEAEARRIEQEKAAAELKAAQAPDREKLLTLAFEINTHRLPEMQTEAGRQVINDVACLLTKVAEYITKKSSQM